MFGIRLGRAEQGGFGDAALEQGNLVLFAKLTVLGNDFAEGGVALDVHGEQVVNVLGPRRVVCPCNLLFNQIN